MPLQAMTQDQSHILWKGAQLAFSLLISVALLAHSIVTLPLAVLGFFPEHAHPGPPGACAPASGLGTRALQHSRG